jgi:acyl-CoA dehydrogenase
MNWIALSAILALCLAVLLIPALRRPILSRFILKVFRKKLPPISRTEQEALEAGTVWWDGQLFSGKPDWKKLLAEPAPKLTAEEQAFLDGSVEDLCAVLDDWQITEVDRDLPPEVWQLLKARGFFGMIIPKKFGGLGFSALAHSSVIQKLGSRSVTAAVTAMVPNSLGPAELLLHYGTDAQRNYYLPRLARGEEIPCFGLTAPEAGSDAASIPDKGVVCRGDFDGGLGIRLNWEKRYITLAPVATLIGLAFKLADPEHLLGQDTDLGITLALIPSSLRGITIGTRHNPLGVPFQNGPTWGKDVMIPLGAVIGGAAGIGQGWKMLMECLAAGRSISLPALSTGGTKLVARVTGAYARVRRQFHLPIGRFEGIEEPLARIAGSAYALEAARVVTCGAIDRGERPSVISAIVKYHATERMRSAVNDGMDILGGSGISLGPRNLLGYAYRCAPIGITVEGANILTRSLIIFGQGVIRCHPYVLREMKAAVDSDRTRALAEFDRAFWGHVCFIYRNAWRTWALGLTGGRYARTPGGPAKRYFRTASRFAAAFTLAADLALLTLGGNLKRKEKLAGRMADILGQLYLVSAMLKQFEEAGRPAEQLPLLRWACEDSFAKIQSGFDGFLRNFPNRLVAWKLRLLIFPLGRRLASPSDRLGREVAALLMEPSPLRDRLTAGLFIPSDPQEPLARLEDALRKVIAAEPLERKLKKGGLDQKDLELIRLATNARREVIRVDDFTSFGSRP